MTLLHTQEVRARAWPGWAHVVGIYVIARLVSACIFSAAALHQGVNPWFEPKPGYWAFIRIWDAQWYERAAEDGYPSQLPLGENGKVQENTWAFYPLFPFLARALSALTGADLGFMLTGIAMLAGLGAALVIYQLFRQIASRTAALWAVVFVAVFPVSPILQVPYAESLNLLLLAASLLFVVQKRYLTAIPVVILMCLSRPTGVPFAAMVGLYLIAQLWIFIKDSRAQKQHASADSVQLLRLAALAVVSVIAALSWPAIAWARTGDPAAYTKTETVWRGGSLVPIKPWFDAAGNLFGPVLGAVAPLLLLGLFVWAMNSRPVRALGTPLRLWCYCYAGYLFVFLDPQTSTFRMLLPLFPLALAGVLISKSRAYRGAVVLMFVLLQIVWVVWLWAWAQLPGGGDYPP
ncbi:hypothetical protein ACQR35_02915 [Pseudarthrobacter sp. J1738]|uniref:hypothetical protein n=1 Tax=unclassified Pseudarthrobacter TaxID=2647000 RepID=UPI003D27C6C7